MAFRVRCPKCPPDSSLFPVPDGWTEGPCPQGHSCRVPGAPPRTTTAPRVVARPIAAAPAPARLRPSTPVSGFGSWWLVAACFFGLAVCGIVGLVVVGVLVVRMSARPAVAEAPKPTVRAEVATKPEVPKEDPLRPPITIPLGPKAVNAPPPPALLPRPVILRVRSLDAFFKAMNRVADAADASKDVKAMETFVRQNWRVANQPVFDMTRPLGVYLLLDPQRGAISTVLMAPVPDRVRFLTWLQNGQSTVHEEEGQPEAFRIERFQIPVPLPQPNGNVAEVRLQQAQPTYCRFAGGYVYLSQGGLADLRDVTAIDPVRLLGDDTRPLLSAHLYFDALPAGFDLKRIQLQPQGKAQVPPGLIGQNELENAMESLGKWLQDFLNEARELSLQLDVPERSDALHVEVSFRAREGSKLDRDLRTLATPSLFGALLRGKSALAVLGHAQLPQGLRDFIAPHVRSITALTLKDVDKEPDAATVKQFFATLEETVVKGELDVAGVIRQNAEGQVESVAGLKLAKADQFEQALKKFAQAAPPKEQKRIQFDVAKVGTVNVHRVDVSPDIPWKLFREDLLDQFTLDAALLAYREDCALAAVGPRGMELMKQAVDSKPTAAPMLHIEANLNQLVPLFGDKAARDVAAKTFADQPGNCLLRIEAEDGLRIRHRLDLSIVRFIRLYLPHLKLAPLPPGIFGD